MTVRIIVEGRTLNECVAGLPSPPWLEAMQSASTRKSLDEVEAHYKAETDSLRNDLAQMTKQRDDLRLALKGETPPHLCQAFEDGFKHCRQRLLDIIARDQKTSPGLTVTLEQVRQKIEGLRMAKDSQWPEIK